VAGTDRETSKKYKLQHKNAFVSCNSENECLENASVQNLNNKLR